MSFSRFIQIILLRDVTTYFIPGVFFLFLLNLYGMNQPIKNNLINLRDIFGPASVGIFMGIIAYTSGNLLYNFTEYLLRKTRNIGTHVDSSNNKKKTLDPPKHPIPIASDLIDRLADALGSNLIKGSDAIIMEEVTKDRNSVKYIRYLCEMLIKNRCPEIHYLMIEKYSSINNFRISIGGAFLLVGLIWLLRSLSLFYYLNSAQGYLMLASSIFLVLVAVVILKQAKKRDDNLRVAIWRACHAVLCLDLREKPGAS
jgi:hypothetical protein